MFCGQPPPPYKMNRGPLYTSIQCTMLWNTAHRPSTLLKNEYCLNALEISEYLPGAPDDPVLPGEPAGPVIPVYPKGPVPPMGPDAPEKKRIQCSFLGSVIQMFRPNEYKIPRRMRMTRLQYRFTNSFRSKGKG